MKCLVVYYSRTGNTKIAAEELAKALKADICEIKETNTKKGFWEPFRVGRDALLKKSPPIQPVTYNAQTYDLVIIGTPVWSGVAAPMRTYLQQNKDKIKKYAVFSTMNSRMHEAVVKEAVQILEKAAIADLKLYAKEIKDKSFIEKVKSFVNQITM